MTGICGVAVLVVLITAAHFPPVSADFSKAGQLLAMQRFYDALGGPSWNPNCAIGWDRRGTEYCGLAGVGCLVNSSNGGFDIITSLYFFGCNLAGTLPVELLDLRGLLIFDIIANLKVTGSIPAGYGTAWPQLTRLAIGSTAMHGSLQTETGYLRQLEILILNGT
ncbi:GP46-like surface antigen, putative [Bodo saltans]|uniref:GP46-like surface antigen, putative n=1 Tax=Bodo saltans TaxID=75058 RepID=A0A0S4JHG5_BODSA|nr:GP46-like surface antigen, putative [Bodo saltans]|eukprot:CUG89690.1 GP46-like surface antigen, putative [Bodo saltans]